MTTPERTPGIDDPSGPGGLMPDERTTPPGDTAGNTGTGDQPHASELDLPGPDDPVAWGYVPSGAEVVGPDGARIGSVAEMLGTEEGIFHGLAVTPDTGGEQRVVPADAVELLTTSRVQVAFDAGRLDDAEPHRPPDAG